MKADRLRTQMHNTTSDSNITVHAQLERYAPGSSTRLCKLGMSASFHGMEPVSSLPNKSSLLRAYNAWLSDQSDGNWPVIWLSLKYSL